MTEKVLSYQEFQEQYYPRLTTEGYRKEMLEKYGIDIEAEQEAMTRRQYEMYLDGML
jgi:hypothetical protein